MIYFTLFGFMLSASFAVYMGKNRGTDMRKIDNFSFTVFAVIMFLLAAMRINIGPDYGSYESLFYSIKSGETSLISFSSEPLFALLNLFAPSYRILLMVTAAIGVFIKCWFYFCNSENKTFVLLLYYSTIFVFYEMGIIREGIAMSFVLVSFSQLKKGNRVGFFIWVAVAALFHITALIVIPLGILGSRTLKIRTYILVIVVAALIGFIFKANIPLVITFLRSVKLDFIAYKLTEHTSTFASEVDITTHIKRIAILMLLFTMYKHHKFSRDFVLGLSKQDSQLYLNGYFLSVVAGLVFASIGSIVSRGVAHLYFLQIVLFSDLISKNPKGIKGITVFFGAVILVFYSLYTTLNSMPGNPYTPYVWILFP